MGTGGGLGFLRSTPARVLTVVLLAQFAGLLALSRQEKVPIAKPLSGFPARIGSWSLYQEGAIDAAEMSVLRADDVMTRTYVDGTQNRAANLFVAYFKSQRTGQTPHSPKNCLPGSGWMPIQSGVVTIPIQGRAEPLRVNRYVVQRGEERSLVLYWYQSRDRVVASEYTAKLDLVLDAIRYNRTDTALVRVVVPISRGDTARANQTAREFVEAFFMPLRHFLPS